MTLDFSSAGIDNKIVVNCHDEYILYFKNKFGFLYFIKIYAETPYHFSRKTLRQPPPSSSSS